MYALTICLPAGADAESDNQAATEPAVDDSSDPNSPASSLENATQPESASSPSRGPPTVQSPQLPSHTLPTSSSPQSENPAQSAQDHVSMPPPSQQRLLQNSKAKDESSHSMTLLSSSSEQPSASPAGTGSSLRQAAPSFNTEQSPDESHPSPPSLTKHSQPHAPIPIPTRPAIPSIASPRGTLGVSRSLSLDDESPKTSPPPQPPKSSSPP